MIVTRFKHLQTKVSNDIPLEKIVNAIQNDTNIKELTLKYRELKSAEKNEEAKNIKKSLLPAFAPAVQLRGGKSRNDIFDITGLCFLDIDNISTDEMTNAIDLLKSDNHIVMFYKSLSGTGLHIIIRYSLFFGENHTQISLTPTRIRKVYGAVFKTISKKYRTLLNHKIDKSGENPERLCLISHDSEIYFNKDATPIIYKYKNQRSTKIFKTFEDINLD
ncbi:MAG: hypothetical protein IKY25_08055 [Alistipes sp.]|nr:hypothetical protein [Alistipes sp.]